MRCSDSMCKSLPSQRHGQRTCSELLESGQQVGDRVVDTRLGRHKGEERKKDIASASKKGVDVYNSKR